MTDRSALADRINAALERMRIQQAGVRCIYLSAPMMRAFDREQPKSRHGADRCFGDHPVRRGTKDVIYSQHGVGFTIPKLLSHRVAA